MVKTLKQSLLIFILSNSLILWLYLFNNFFVVDVLIYIYVCYLKQSIIIIQ